MEIFVELKKINDVLIIFKWHSNIINWLIFSLEVFINILFCGLRD